MIVMYALAFLLLLSISYFTLSGVFGLALFGDDFLTIWRYLYLVGAPNHRPEWNNINYFLTPYGPQDTITGLLYKVFGLQAQYYHITSLIFRLTAALTLIPIVFYFTKNRLSAFFATLFFSITVIGFDTTNWVFNMTSYLSLASFNLYLYFFLKSRDQNLLKIKLLLLSGLFYFLTFITSPIRMTGLLPFTLIIELLYLIQNRNLKTLKQVGVRLGMIILIMGFITVSGESTGPKTDISSRFINGLSTTISLLSQGRFDFLFYPVVMFGGMFMPDLIAPNLPSIAKKLDLFKNILLPYFFIFILFILGLKINIPKLKKKFVTRTIVLSVIWSMIVTIVYSQNLVTFSDPKTILLLLIGGSILILTFSLSVEYRLEKKISNALVYSIIWSIVSFIAAWFWIPTTIYPTIYRYLTGSAIGIAIFLSTLISLGQNSTQRIRLFLFLSVFLIIQIVATRTYLDQLVGMHGINLSNKIWSQMPYFPLMGKTEVPLIFYFEGKENGIVHNVLLFNFDYRNALLYNIWDDKIPLTMGDWPSVVSAVTDGKIFKAYGRPQKPLPIEQVYAFHLEGTDHLINITEEARKKLKEIVQTK